MKWVKLGMGQAAIFVAVAWYVDGMRWPALLGGVLAGALMWASYAHARSAGLRSGLPGTESY